MMRRLLLSLTLLLTLPVSAGAAGYRVDLVVFAYEPPQTRELLLPLEGPVPPVQGMEPAAAGLQTVPLSASMAGIAKKLRNTHGYRVLTTLAWIQPASGRSGAKPVRVRRGGGTAASGTGAPELDGSVRLDAGRFLHFSTDLLFTPAGGPQAERATFRVLGKQRLRPGQVHYLDHPQVGVLVSVNPTE